MANLIPHPHIRTFSKAALLAGVVMAGTGGTLNSPASPGYMVGYAIPGLRYSGDGLRSARAKSQLRTITDGLKTTNSGVARALGVSRQALYNWLKGSQPSGPIQQKLDRLVLAAEILRTHRFPIRAALSQPLERGRNFWQLVEAGSEPDTLARKLMESHAKRESQRTLIADRIALKRDKGVMEETEHDQLG